jgi:hypothetical protein
MSSYFDELDSHISDLVRTHTGTDTAILSLVADIEDAVMATVYAAILDKEFPGDLRLRAIGVMRDWALRGDPAARVPGSAGNDEPRRWFLSVRYSRLLAELHSFFHDVARRRIQTRFGLLFDSPAGMVSRAQAWDEEHNRGG